MCFKLVTLPLDYVTERQGEGRIHRRTIRALYSFSSSHQTEKLIAQN